ncbi:MAG: amidase [Fimbriimonadaceae bacterium]|nr:amidase [Fimbriimonadaceae bacterium]
MFRMTMGRMTRKDFLRGFAASVAATALPRLGRATEGADLTLDDLRAAQRSLGLSFTDAELKEALSDVKELLGQLPGLRAASADFNLAPATVFRVMAADKVRGTRVTVRVRDVGDATPVTEEDWAFAKVAELGKLLRAGKTTSVELTKLSLSRLKKYGPKLRCVVTLTEDLALKQAERADRELREGHDRGPLHGLPYGLKDLFAVPGYPTTWGAAPYRDQRIEVKSGVYERLEASGAVLVAKLSMGALAMGDVWFEGRTESPWNPKIGASGSSAGSGSATAAGLVAFAIGTETSGSIVSPSHNNRVTGLRPTFGSVTRYGAMPLSWSMDKVGPMCRDAEDCALVFAALVGRDPRDPSTISRPFEYRSGIDVKRLKIGALVGKGQEGKPLDLGRRPELRLLQDMGAKLEPVYLDPGPSGLSAVLMAEASASFDAFTRSDKVHELKDSGWPQYFRGSRFLSGVDHVQADRARRTLAVEMEEKIGRYDVIVAPGPAYQVVYALNLTGHPQVLVPFGLTSDGSPRSLSLIGPAFSEGRLLAVAWEIQKRTKQTLLRPDMRRWA